jgi:hypothetical protein
MTASWINNSGDRGGVLAEVPQLARLQGELYRSLWQQSHLPPRILELCRLRLAQLHRCEAELQHGDWEAQEEKRENLSAWPDAALFTDAEQACLEFTEVYAMDVQAITDEQAAAVKADFGDAGLVMLIEALGIFDARMRLALLWQLPVERGGGARDGH